MLEGYVRVSQVSPCRKVAFINEAAFVYGNFAETHAYADMTEASEVL